MMIIIKDVYDRSIMINTDTISYVYINHAQQVQMCFNNGKILEVMGSFEEITGKVKGELIE